ncbi:hypothetical protein GCM10009559_48890 [Pseudonocardia zijingensis]|uniref:Uncharacterized protein n=1 Tax=Pseudonocardia zijingensis TaxID=153376 RepID=A0ABP4BC49_9PSEU
MAGEQQPVAVGAAQHGEAQQRRAHEVERRAPVGRHDRLGARGALLGRESRQVDLGHGGFEPPGEDGHRAVQPGVGEPEPQRRVLLQQQRARRGERVDIEPGVEVEGVLREVDVALAGDAGLEEQTLLQGRQRPDVRHRHRVRRLDRLHVVLGEVDEREVRRRVPAQLRAPGERAQRLRPERRQPAHLVGAEDAGGPGQRGPPVPHDVDLEGVHRGAGVQPRPDGGEAPVLIGAATAAAAVVDHDLRGDRGQAGLLVEEAQHAVADAGRGHPKLFLHALRRPGQLRAVGPGDIARVEAHRVDAGERPHGARQVGVPVEQVALPAVALHPQQHRRARVDPAVAPPPLQREGEPGEQEVVHTAVDRPGQGAEHRTGQLDVERGSGGVDVHRGVERAVAQERVGGAHHVAPVVELGAEAPVGGGLPQGLRPRPVRGADRLEVGLAPLGERLPGDREVGGEDAPGHPVDDEVVRHQQQPARLPEPVRPQHDPALRVELGGRVPGGPLDGLHRRDVRRLAHHPREWIRVLRHSYPLTTGDLRAQHRVPFDDGGQDALQIGAGERRGRAHQHRLEEVLERDAVGGDLRHHGRERHLPHAVVGLRHRRRFRPEAGGERLDGAQPEDVARGDPQPGAPRAPGHRDRGDAVAAEGEEVVVDADPVEPERVGEQATEPGLPLGARPAVGHEPGEVRVGQRGPVELAVRGERERVQRHDDRGHHVLGQLPRHPLPQLLRVGGAAHVGDEPAVAHHHDRAGHAACGHEGGLDLPRFDAETAHLHLVVAAAEDLQHAGGVPAGEVAAAVHPLPRDERVGDEPLGGEAGPVQVAVRQLHAREVQLARHPGRHRAQRGVEHVQPGVGHGAPDRHRPAGRPLRGVPGRDVDGGLGGAVDVVQLGAGQFGDAAEPGDDVGG